ncbi:enoyl-CoA hydratase/isomerase family protein [Halioxenophilus aromaticivorans]|uniref:Enoyl-CoA hydratase/isomerase family protein n=1 Tax=Halioxenophilus aromaticivorans TaxID=1306992 RepID=A0AAV3TX29_9ALTE
MSESVTLTIDGHIATLTFANPPLNFATIRLVKLIADNLEEIDNNSHIRVVVLKSAGDIFCAGADLQSENGFGAKGDDPLRELYDQALRIYAAKKPIIAQVRGAAIGAGLGLALTADFRIATPKARFSANFAKLGFHPGFGLTYTVPKLVGEQRAAEMFLTAERYKPDLLQQWGMVNRVTSEDSIEDETDAFAQKIASNAPLSLLSTRETLRMGMLEHVTQAIVREHSVQIELFKTKDFAEGVQSVNERRPGSFTGQ